MTRTLLVVPLLTALLLAGCSSDGSSDAGESPEATQSSTPAPTTAPVTLRTYPGFFSCQVHHGAVLQAGSMRVTRPVTLDDAQLTGVTNIDLGKASVAARPEGKGNTAGSYPGAEPGPLLKTALGWDDRQPLVGAQLTPGKYYYFLPLDVGKPAAHVDGAKISWSEDGTSGTSDAAWVTDFKKSCQ